MEYMFYTPPNTAPAPSCGVTFDDEVALMEAQHFMATAQLAEAIDINTQAVENVSARGPSAVSDIQRSRSARIEELKANVSDLEQQITAHCATKQQEWDDQRAAYADRLVQQEHERAAHEQTVAEEAAT